MGGQTAYPYLAMGLALVATIIVALYEIRGESKMRLCFTWTAVGYTLLLIFGSCVATMLAWPILRDGVLAGRDPLVVQTIAAFVGVFGAQGIIRKMGVTAFGSNVLTFDVWVTRALDHAVTSQFAAGARAAAIEDVKLARLAAKAADLDTLVLRLLGDGAAAEQLAIAQRNQADVALTKALALVEKNRDAVLAFVKK